MGTDNIALVSAFENLAIILDQQADNVVAAAKRDEIEPDTFDTWVSSLRDEAERARAMTQAIRDESKV
jgi:hypothetical protein